MAKVFRIIVIQEQTESIVKHKRKPIKINPLLNKPTKGLYKKEVEKL